METKRYGWEAQARRTILSEERELLTLPGVRIRARKFTIAAADEIRAAQMHKRETLPREVQSFMMRAASEGKEFSDAIASLPPEEAASLIAQIPPESSSMTETIRLSIMSGLGEHNLDDPDHVTSVVSRELVERVMEYPETAQEIYGIIEEWNAPLPKATPRTSGTSPNGSTKEPGSSGETPSPTDESPKG